MSFVALGKGDALALQAVPQGGIQNAESSWPVSPRLMNLIDGVQIGQDGGFQNIRREAAAGERRCRSQVTLTDTWPRASSPSVTERME